MMIIILSILAFCVIFILAFFSSRCLLTILEIPTDLAEKKHPTLIGVLFIVYSVCCVVFFYFLPQPKAALHNFLKPSIEVTPEAKPDYPALGQITENAGQSLAYSTLTPKEATVSEHNSNSSQGNEGHPQEEQAAPQEPAAVPPQPSSLPLVIEEPITPLLRPQRPPVIVESKRPVIIKSSSQPKPKKDKRGKEDVAYAKAAPRQDTAPKEIGSCKMIKGSMDSIDREKFLEIKKGVAPTNILINPINGNIYRVFPQSGQGNSRCGSYLIDATINGKNISCSETACD